MAELRIGRVGFDVDIPNPDRIRSSVGSRNHRVTLEFEIRSSSLANTKAIKAELEQHAELQHVVPVTLNSDAFIDAFYRITDVDIDAEDYAVNDTGLFDGRVTLERVGSIGSVKFESALQGLLFDNDYGLLEAEVDYTWAPPVGAKAITDVGDAATPPTAFDRTTVDGTIRVFRDVDKTKAPTWSVAPADYLKGASKIRLGGYTRAGVDAPEDLTSWKISTGIVDLFADGSNNGALNLQSTVDQTPYGFNIVFESTTAIPGWNYPSIVYNEPERCVLSLTRDADEADPTAFLHYLEIVAPRGMPFVVCRFVWTGGATTWSVDRETTDAATAVTPTGASGNMAVEGSANDADGNRWFIGGFEHGSVDTTNGGLNWTANTNEFAFVLGMEMGGSSAATNDDTGAVMLQASAWLWEIVRSARR